MIRVGIDLDGCAYPFTEEIKEWAEKRLGYALPPFTHWNSHQKHWGLNHGQLSDLMAEALVAGELWSKKLPECFFARALADLRTQGFEVVIATDRLQGTELADLAQLTTIEWLEKNSVEYDEIVFTGDKRDARCHYFIEDRPQAVPLLRLAGCDAVYYDRPWNHWFPGPRVQSWTEFVTYVEDKENGK